MINPASSFDVIHPRKGKLKALFVAQIVAVFFSLCLPAMGSPFGHDMRLESIDGDVTTNEYKSFIEHLDVQLPPIPSNNIGTVMVYERVGGATLHGMQTFYEFTHDKRVLDHVIEWSDAFLHARNDPTTGRMVWTGNRELCWPNKETNDEAHVLYSGTENGDVIEHIVNTAKLILENPSVWNEAAPSDKFGFGATYLDRAKTYVRECQRSAETTIVPWFVRSTREGYRLIHPDSPVYYKYCESKGPVPWNQQQFIVGGLLRLAQCHRLLNDGNANIAYYEKITADAADWFFSTCRLVQSKDHACYQWAYVVTIDIPSDPEDTGHSYYDVFVYRAYLAKLGPTRTNMQRLINTARFIMYLGTNHFSGIINGTSNERRYVRDYLNYPWIEMSVLDKEFYKMTANAVLASHEYYDNISVEAAVLAAKHFWATNTIALPEIVEDASQVPPFVQIAPWRAMIKRHAPNVPPAGFVLLIWVFSEMVLTLFKRSKSNATSKDRNSLKLIWFVNTLASALGIMAAYRFPAGRILWPIIPSFGYGLFVAGIALRWYSIIHLGRFFTTNVAIASDHRVVDTGPYHFIRHPSYTGSLIGILGFCLLVQNWLSLLIIFVPICAVQMWRIHIEETALLEGLGESYRSYMRRTKCLIPFIY